MNERLRELLEALRRPGMVHVLDAGVIFKAYRPQQAPHPFDRAAQAREIVPADVSFAPLRGDQ